MLDYRFIKENLAAVKQNIADRYMVADADLVVALYDERTATLKTLEEQRKKRNENAAAMKGKLSPEERARVIEEGKALKESIAALEASLQDIEKRLYEAAMRIPNMAHPDAPRGKEDKDNLEVKRVGSPTVFDFEPKDHVQLGQELDLIDFDTATRVSGTKFYYLKNEAVFLELALERYALNLLQKKGIYGYLKNARCSKDRDFGRHWILFHVAQNPISTLLRTKICALSAPQRLRSEAIIPAQCSKETVTAEVGRNFTLF